MPMKRLAYMAASAALITVAMIPMARAQIAVPLPSGRAPIEFYTTMLQVDPGDDPANWSPWQNVVDSYRYEQLVRDNPAFRAERVRKECGPVTDPDLLQQCLATFEY